jgi:uncharacterized protein involved in exopolysaccharide biosynthesis
MMFALPGFFWKAATGAAGVLALVLATLAMTTYFENRSITKQRNELSAQINDPVNGYIAQLTRLKQDNAELHASLDDQSAEVRRLSEESQRRLDAAQAQLAAALRDQRRLEGKLAGFMATGPQGSSFEERVRDIDTRVMEELSK